MTSTIDYTRYRVDEFRILHAPIDKLVQLCQIIPPLLIIRLYTLHPIKEASYPLELGIIRIGANLIGRFTKVNIGVFATSPILRRLGTEVIIEFSVITHSGRLNDSSAPPAATLDVCSAGHVGNGLGVVEASTLLIWVYITVFWWIIPGIVTPKKGKVEIERA